jgi:arginase family enzyme
MSDLGNESLTQDEAEELLEEAVDNIAEVQDHYDGLTDDMDDMLRDSKSGIASVYLHFDGPVVMDI